MIKREAQKTLQVMAGEFPAIAVIGPRQAGKTTLVRQVFKDKDYVSMEDLDHHVFAQEDPRGFLAQFPNGAIIDEAQRNPELFNYLQGILDADGRTGLFILTGSSHFMLNRSISQSLAGRVGIMTLLPFSLCELARAKATLLSANDYIYSGFFPRIQVGGSEPRRWLNAYIETYVQKDIRLLMDIGNLDAFLRFVALCAGTIGSLVNLNRIASDCSISVNTAKSWLSLLKASYICFTLRPHSENFRKRLVKTPKLYFYDTGLACRLMKIQNARQLDLHPLRGALFENLVIAEMLKTRLNRALDPAFYFWRDHKGLEIDLIIDTGQHLLPLEIKSGQTINNSWFQNLQKWRELSGDRAGPPHLCYGGVRAMTRSGIRILPWNMIGRRLLE